MRRKPPKTILSPKRKNMNNRRNKPSMRKVSVNNMNGNGYTFNTINNREYAIRGRKRKRVETKTFSDVKHERGGNFRDMKDEEESEGEDDDEVDETTENSNGESQSSNEFYDEKEEEKERKEEEKEKNEFFKEPGYNPATSSQNAQWNKYRLANRGQFTTNNDNTTNNLSSDDNSNNSEDNNILRMSDEKMRPTFVKPKRKMRPPPPPKSSKISEKMIDEEEDIDLELFVSAVDAPVHSPSSQDDKVDFERRMKDEDEDKKNSIGSPSSRSKSQNEEVRRILSIEGDFDQKYSPIRTTTRNSDKSSTGNLGFLNMSSDQKWNSNVSGLEPVKMKDEEEDVMAEKRKLSYWLPERDFGKLLEVYYKNGVKELFPWQAACLDELDWNKNENLIYSIPTSGGKTLVSEIIMMKNLKHMVGKKCIFVVPYIAMAEEKIAQLKGLLNAIKKNVDTDFKLKRRRKRPMGYEDEVDVSVCTMERANKTVNMLLEKNNLDCVRTVIIDEVHMINDESRGYILETLITKILYYNRHTKDNDPRKKIQIIAMSATVPNIRDLASWLDARLFYSNWRPVPLREYYYDTRGKSLFYLDENDDLYKKQTSYVTRKNTKYNIMEIVDKEKHFTISNGRTCDVAHQYFHLIKETVDNQKSVLVFCKSRNDCENECQKIGEEFRNLAWLERKCRGDFQQLEDRATGLRIGVLQELKDLVYCEEKLLKSIEMGVSYHHAGLSSQEKTIIEKGFCSGAIRVLICTTTLAVGVNLPARRVIFHSLKSGISKMTKSKYKQAAGRAGRFGKDEYGESIIISPYYSDKSTEKRFLKPGLEEPVLSCLVGDKKGMKLCILEFICSQSQRSRSIEGVPVDQIREFAKTTFFCSTLKEEQTFLEATNSLNFLYEKNLIDVVEKPTKETATPCTPMSYSPESLFDGDGFDVTVDTKRSNNFDYIGKLDFSLRFVPTRLGLGVFRSALNQNEALFVFKELIEARTEGLILNGNLHSLYLVAPFDGRIFMSNDRLKKIREKCKDGRVERVVLRIGLDEGILAYSEEDLKKDENSLRKIKKLFAASVIEELINEEPVGKIANDYCIGKGDIQAIQRATARMCDMIQTFCSEINFSNFKMIFKNLLPRISFGVRGDLVKLLKLPSCDIMMAKKLYRRGGIRDIRQLATKREERVAEILKVNVSFVQNRKRRKLGDGHYLKKAKTLIEDARIYLIKEKAKNEIPKIDQYSPELKPVPNPIKNIESEIKDMESFPSPFQDSYFNDGIKLVKSYVELDVLSRICDSLSLITMHVKFRKPDRESGDERKFYRSIENVVFLIDYLGRLRIFIIPYQEMKESGKFKLELINDSIKRILEKDNSKVGYNLKKQLKYLIRNEFVVNGNLHDPRILHYLETLEGDEKNYKIKNMYDVYRENYSTMTKSVDDRKDVVIFDNSKKKSIKKVIQSYCIYQIFKNSLLRSFNHVYYNLEVKMIRILARMEAKGIGFDRKKNRELEEACDEVLLTLKASIFSFNDGNEFSISSPKEVYTVLYKINKLKYPGNRHDEETCSTKKEILLRTHENDGRGETSKVCRDIMNYRKVMSFKTKELGEDQKDAEYFEINGKRKYFKWSQISSQTGRFTSRLQQTMNNFEVMSVNFRSKSSFVPKEGFDIVSFDFAQMELRILAHFSGDEVLGEMLNVCGPEKDIFTDIGKMVFPNGTGGNASARDLAKGIVYGILYGMGDASLKIKLKVYDNNEAHKFKDVLLNTFPKVKKFVAYMKEESRNNGKVETLGGRIRRTFSKEWNKKEREYINTKIQGTASDIFKFSLICILDKLEKGGNVVRFEREDWELVNCIHDEFLFEIRKAKLETIVGIIKSEMENCLQRSSKLFPNEFLVKFPVRVKKGSTWSNLEEYEEGLDKLFKYSLDGKGEK